MRNLFTSCYLFLGILLTGSTGCQPDTQEASSTQPNILFIMSDDHTSQAWGVYGSILDSVIDNPHIQRLVDEGCLLSNSFCTNSICVPSRATILTGQYSHQNRVYTLSDPLPSQRDHVAKHLQQAGYETAIIGKWHLKERPAGFDHYNVLPGQGRYHDPILKNAENWEDGGTVYEGFSSDVIGDLAVDWLTKNDNNQPFFLMCHFKATHEPFDYPDRYASLYEDMEMPEPASLYEFGPAESGRTFDGQVLSILEERYHSDLGNRYPGMPFSTEGLDQRAARKKTYQKFVKDFLRSGKAIDDNIGKLLDYLDETGLSENTVVIYTADQGYFLGEHGFFDKRIMYEEPLIMPFVIRYPPEIPAGSVLEDIVLNTDFAPLLLDYAGVDRPAYMQGKSFRSNLAGDTPAEWRSSMYYRYWLHQTQRPAHFGIRKERYKLIFFYGQPLDMTGAHQESTEPGWEFYDLQEDPHENHNAYHEPKYQEIIESMKEELISLREQVGDTDENYQVVREIMEEHW